MFAACLEFFQWTIVCHFRECVEDQWAELEGWGATVQLGLGLFHLGVPWNLVGSEWVLLVCSLTALAGGELRQAGGVWGGVSVTPGCHVVKCHVRGAQKQPSYLDWVPLIHGDKLCGYSSQLDFCFGPRDNLNLMLHMMRSHADF